MRGIIMLTAMACLAACGDGDQPTVVANRTAPETGAAAQVARLAPDLRNGVFEKAIKASGAACPRVTGAERVEVRTGVKGWKASCDNETAHLIEIVPDGTAKVTSRTY